MYQIGEQFLYGIHGVCKIIAIESKKIGGKTAQYYVLKPADQTDAVFYVPTQNEAAVAKLRPMLTQAELDSMLNSADIKKNRMDRGRAGKKAALLHTH